MKISRDERQQAAAEVIELGEMLFDTAIDAVARHVWITLLMTGWSTPPRIQANKRHCRAKKHQRR
jgi:hypothetical protein